jgi:hypothetical protein
LSDGSEEDIACYQVRLPLAPNGDVLTALISTPRIAAIRLRGGFQVSASGTILPVSYCDI